MSAPQAPAAKAPRTRGGFRWRFTRPERDDGRGRIRLAAAAFAVAYLVVIARLVMFGLAAPADDPASASPTSALAANRPNIVDRNGQILATDIRTASVYAEPRKILDPDEASEELAAVFPDLDAKTLRTKLATNAGFAWIKREITPAQEQAVHSLGIPGIAFVSENKRFYPGGDVASHIMGMVNVDNQGIAGIEKYIDDQGLADLHAAGFARGDALSAVTLSIDLRVQNIVHDELQNAMQTYSAEAATAVVLNVRTGEILASASLPDYDPNSPTDAQKPDRFNRMTAGVFELGSVFKSFTFAEALDSGTWTLADKVDVGTPIHVGGFTINDFEDGNGIITLPQVFTFSSNIGAAKMAAKAGGALQQEYFRRFGFFNTLHTELPETAKPIFPAKWSDITTLTAAYGHGIAVSPLQVAVADAALVNGGIMIPPTFLPRTAADAAALGTRVVSQNVSNQLRYLFRLNVEQGTGGNAAVPGYMVGGKTGTAEKVENGKYSTTKNLNSFVSVFPVDNPQYIVLVVVDDPQPTKPGAGRTAAYNAAVTAGAIVRRSAALLGVAPRVEQSASALLASN